MPLKRCGKCQRFRDRCRHKSVSIFLTRRRQSRRIHPSRRWRRLSFGAGPNEVFRVARVRAVDARSSSANLRASIRSLLLPSFNSEFFRGLQTTIWLTCALSKSYNQAAQVLSSKVTRRSARKPATNCRMVPALVSMMDSITRFPTQFITPIEIVSL